MIKGKIRIYVFLLLLSIVHISHAEEHTINQPPQKHNERLILIEGVGGALSTNLLAPKIIKLYETESKRMPTIFYGTDLNFDKLPESGQRTIKLLEKQGMVFIDKSKNQDLMTYNAIEPDYVFIATPPATHIPLTKQWMHRANPPKAILIEKPFTENLIEMKDFAHYLNAYPKLKDRVYAFDFAEIAFDLAGNKLKQISSYLSGINRITLFWIENNSGETTDNPRLLLHDDRPISRENRVSVLQYGMVFDELVHLFPAIHNLVDIGSAKIKEIKAAQYENAEIIGETFVAACLSMKSKLNAQEIPITVYAGKGIGGVDMLNLHRTGVHVMLLHGNNGKTVTLSIDEAEGHYLDKNGTSIKKFQLPNKYEPVMSNLFLKKAEMGQNIEEGVVNIRLATRIRKIIIDYTKTNKFPTYAVGTKKSPAPSIESILSNIPKMHGDEEECLLIRR
jgi:GFO/IDH/MocA oxidoreductase family protein